MSRSHILLVSQIPLWSMGAATGGPAFRETLKHLGRHFDVSLVTPKLDYVEQTAIPEGVELHTFSHRFHGVARQVPKVGWATDTLGWYAFGSAAWPIVKRIQQTNPIDAAYGYEVYGVPVARRAANRFGVPMIARYQGTLMSSRRGEHLAGLRYHKHLAALRTPADIVIMTDDGTLGDRVLADLGHAPDLVRFWPNGVDHSIVRSPITRDVMRAELGLSENALLLLTVSRLSHWKRVDRAIDVAALLHETGLPVELAIVGGGPEEARLRERAAARLPAEHVRFVGAVERSRLAGFYRAADALLSLYDYSNLANPVLEAMLLGTPLVALDVGGTGNLVLDGVNGVLCEDSDVHAIADRVGELLEDAAWRHALGASAETWARENLWSWDERMAMEIVEIERLVGGGVG